MLEAYDGDVIDGYYYFLASDDLDMYFKGTVTRQGNSAGRIKPSQMKFVDEFVKMNLIELQFNRYLLGSADSRNPEMAGITGSYLWITICHTYCFCNFLPSRCLNCNLSREVNKTKCLL